MGRIDKLARTERRHDETSFASAWSQLIPAEPDELLLIRDEETVNRFAGADEIWNLFSNRNPGMLHK